MEQVKKRANKVRTIVMNGVTSTIETVWAIGTSIAGTDVLKKTEYNFKLAFIKNDGKRNQKIY